MYIASSKTAHYLHAGSLACLQKTLTKKKKKKNQKTKNTYHAFLDEQLLGDMEYGRSHRSYGHVPLVTPSLT